MQKYTNLFRLKYTFFPHASNLFFIPIFAIAKVIIMKLADLNLNLAYTYADYLKWQIEQRIELIKGKIFKMSVPTRVHQELSSVISNQLYNFLKTRNVRSLEGLLLHLKDTFDKLN